MRKAARPHAIREVSGGPETRVSLGVALSWGFFTIHYNILNACFLIRGVTGDTYTLKLTLLDTMVTGDTYTLKLTVLICFETAHSSLLLLDKLSTINAGSIVIRSIFIIHTHSFCPSPDNESIWYRFEDVWCTHVQTVPPTLIYLHYIHACMMYPVATYTLIFVSVPCSGS